jgi:catechol 2,3-dioxygenase-like lactoylglutathione lyase family enzyme
MENIPRVPRPDNVPSPVRFAHAVLQTNDPEAMREWYSTVLGVEVDMDDITRRLRGGEPEAASLMPRPHPVEA